MKYTEFLFQMIGPYIVPAQFANNLIKFYRIYRTWTISYMKLHFPEVLGTDYNEIFSKDFLYSLKHIFYTLQPTHFQLRNTTFSWPQQGRF